ncbi:DUF6646 family protein [Lacinutrix sp. MedPE-SW]|uniref:DUF6646 family protein n=1 Tax=Lacinutrix sp. MedPE-SW TaxID=1860087 RepID=UPI000913BF93|nr:DUF6646 family protein [Lacinutrix sp. MedPE-SW]OIQ15454.1 MAG: hypothetical protein BM549_13900 [Lacinutrix sp. MedPE-SW]
MKKILLLITLVSTVASFGQAYSGKGDQKLSVGANLQDNATGINLNYDYGLGENISVGIATAYALNTDISSASFGDRFDIKARFNANLGNVLNVSDNFDIYPGLSLGLKNFGGHLGARYFFSSGFGIYAEIGTPLAKYESDTLTLDQKIHNQFVGNIGAVFNL